MGCLCMVISVFRQQVLDDIIVAQERINIKSISTCVWFRYWFCYWVGNALLRWVNSRSKILSSAYTILKL